MLVHPYVLPQRYYLKPPNPRKPPLVVVQLRASDAKVDINVQALSELSQARHDPVG